MKKESRLFGRNKFFSPVVFEGNENDIGKIMKVKIEETNQLTLFGNINKNKNKMKAA